MKVSGPEVTCTTVASHTVYSSSWWRYLLISANSHKAAGFVWLLYSLSHVELSGRSKQAAEREERKTLLLQLLALSSFRVHEGKKKRCISIYTGAGETLLKLRVYKRVKHEQGFKWHSSVFFNLISIYLIWIPNTRISTLFGLLLISSHHMRLANIIYCYLESDFGTRALFTSKWAADEKVLGKSAYF